MIRPMPQWAGNAMPAQPQPFQQGYAPAGMQQAAQQAMAQAAPFQAGWAPPGMQQAAPFQPDWMPPGMQRMPEQAAAAPVAPTMPLTSFGWQSLPGGMPPGIARLFDRSMGAYQNPQIMARWGAPDATAQPAPAESVINQRRRMLGLLG